MPTPKETARALVAAKMQPMAISAKERKKLDAPMMASPGKASGPSYPWGLRLDLDDATMKKLKLRTDLKAGQVVMLTGKAKVTRCEETEDESGERCSCTIQITDLALVPMRTAKARMHKDD